MGREPRSDAADAVAIGDAPTEYEMDGKHSVPDHSSMLYRTPRVVSQRADWLPGQEQRAELVLDGVSPSLSRAGTPFQATNQNSSSTRPAWS
jgi:hypothetical protein